MGFRFTTRAGHPTFVDLPWEQPLAEWDTDRLVAPVRGISRHVVRFVAYGPDLYALKELPDRLAEKEYRLLRELDERLVPVVEAVGVATGRTAARRAARRRAHHAPPPVLAALPRPVRPGVAGRSVGPDARRPRPADRAGPPGRVLLGGLLAVEHAVPPGRGGAGRLAGRRGDRRAARPPVRRPARPRPDHRRGERGRRAARHHGRGARSRVAPPCPPTTPAPTRRRWPRTCAAATTPCGTS